MSDKGISPPPWGTMAGCPWNILDATGRRIAWVNGNDYKTESNAEDEANAALMAEAPEWKRKAEELLAEAWRLGVAEKDALKECELLRDRLAQAHVAIERLGVAFSDAGRCWTTQERREWERAECLTRSED